MESELDGLRFDPNTVTAERIAEDADHEGARVSFTAYLERAKIPIQIDIGFGDAVTPPPVEHNYPTLLGTTAPRLLTYPRETVVAEKLEAMVKLGIANSRMKHFYDRAFSFDGKTLGDAIRNSFERRGTELASDGTPQAFTLDFYEDVKKIRQSIAFSEQNRSYVEPIEFKTLVAHIAKFFLPVTSAAHQIGIRSLVVSLAPEDLRQFPVQPVVRNFRRAHRNTLLSVRRPYVSSVRPYGLILVCIRP